MKTLILILLLAFTASAQSLDNKAPFDEWLFIQQGSGPNGVVNLHIAPKTIQRNDDQIKVWMQITTHYGSPFKDNWHGPLPAVLPDLGRGHATLDCKARKMKIEESIIYNRELHMFYPTIKETVKEQPGTLGWIVFEYFCEREGKKLTGPPTLK